MHTDEIKSVSQSLGFGYAPRAGVKAWMLHRGFATYGDYVRSCVGRDRAALQAEVEAFVFASRQLAAVCVSNP